MNARHQKIIQLVNDKGSVSVNELSHLTGVSEVTIRQDLTALERENYLKRVHGSAIAMDLEDVGVRMNTRFPLKKTLAEYAASQVKDGESVFIEGGSTNALLARSLADNPSITLVTDSHYITQLLKNARCEVIVLGGLYQKGSESVVGPLTRLCIQHVHFQKAFIGVDGWHKDTGFTGRNMMRSDVVCALLDKGIEAIALTDSSKFGIIHPYPLSTENHGFRHVITDSQLPSDALKCMQEQGIQVDQVTDEAAIA